MWNRRVTDQSGHAPMPVIVGSPRSGTTLLRLMIDAHPDLAIPPETGFLTMGSQLLHGNDSPLENLLANITAYPGDAPGWPDFQLSTEALREELLKLPPFDLSNGLRAFYRLYAARFGKLRWGEKTPLYCHHMLAIERLLPEAHFIHIVRDGRDAAVSLREHWFSPGHDIEIQASYWRNNVLTARGQGRNCRHYLEIRYEDLIGDVALHLRRICEFIQIDYHDCMRNYHHGAAARLAEHRGRYRADGTAIVTAEQRVHQQARTQMPPNPDLIGRWKIDFTADEKKRFDELAGDALEQFGYETAT